MNYKKIHDSIIENAKKENRKKDKDNYYELHHIKPKAFFPELKNEKNNLVLLTPREHFLIHYLLWKLHPERRYRDPILYFKKKLSKNSRLYEAARISHIKDMKNNNPSTKLSEEKKNLKALKVSEYAKNRSEEHKENLRLSIKNRKPTRTGAILDKTVKEKISESVKKWHEEFGVSDSTKEKLRIANTGKKHSSKTIEKCKQSAKRRKKYDCPLCESKQLDGGNFHIHMNRHHNWSKELINDYKQNILS